MDSITKQTFEEADLHTKLSILYDHVDAIRSGQAKNEKRKHVNTAVSSFFGVMGGFLAVIVLSWQKFFIQ